MKTTKLMRIAKSFIPYFQLRVATGHILLSNTPKELVKLIQEAHDFFCYSTIYKTLVEVSSGKTKIDLEPDTYIPLLLLWANSTHERTEYCDQALQEIQADGFVVQDFKSILMHAQKIELDHISNSVLTSLNEILKKYKESEICAN